MASRYDDQTRTRSGGTATHDYPRRTLSAGTLKGDRVVNGAGEDLGKIDDFMIDLRHGRIAYAVLSFGGFLGMGDKLFAVPWSALRLDQEHRYFVLDVPKERLEKAPGFDKNAWPDMDNADWRSQIHGYYGVTYMD
jgi:sporulation protein YlmC with PRC-barrel domain